MSLVGEGHARQRKIELLHDHNKATIGGKNESEKTKKNQKAS